MQSERFEVERFLWRKVDHLERNAQARLLLAILEERLHQGHLGNRLRGCAIPDLFQKAHSRQRIHVPEWRMSQECRQVLRSSDTVRIARRIAHFQLDGHRSRHRLFPADLVRHRTGNQVLLVTRTSRHPKSIRNCKSFICWPYYFAESNQSKQKKTNQPTKFLAALYTALLLLQHPLQSHLHTHTHTLLIETATKDQYLWLFNIKKWWQRCVCVCECNFNQYFVLLFLKISLH